MVECINTGNSRGVFQRLEQTGTSDHYGKKMNVLQARIGDFMHPCNSFIVWQPSPVLGCWDFGLVHMGFAGCEK